MPTIAHQLSPFLPVWSGYIILSTLLFSFDGAKLPTLLHLVFTGTIKFAPVKAKDLSLVSTAFPVMFCAIIRAIAKRHTTVAIHPLYITNCFNIEEPKFLWEFFTLWLLVNFDAKVNRFSNQNMLKSWSFMVNLLTCLGIYYKNKWLYKKKH
jgi:hypothetical protein